MSVLWPSKLIATEIEMPGVESIRVAAVRRKSCIKVHAAARGLSREQIEHAILNSRDLSKKVPPLRRLAYAMRTASKAIAMYAQ